MGIIIPKFGMAAMQSVLPATPATTSPLGNTPGAINTKSTWQQVVAATSFDVAGVTIIPNITNIVGAATNMLLDIGVGAAASEQVLISNMLGGGSGSLRQNQSQVFFPVSIPKGQRVAWRLQSNPARTLRIYIFFHGGASWAPWPLYSGVDCIGADTSTSSGLAHTAGNTGTESTWTNIGSVTARQYRAVQLVVQTDTSITVGDLAYHAEIGYSSTTIAEYWFATDTNERCGNIFPFMPHPVNIPTGTQMMIRAECSGTGEALQYGILAFY